MTDLERARAGLASFTRQYGKDQKEINRLRMAIDKARAALKGIQSGDPDLIARIDTAIASLKRSEVE